MPLLLALDGESHTAAAVDWALVLARRLELPITAVHVKDPYLKQFENEIYAQGREEYVAHVERCLTEQADALIAEFTTAATARDVDFDTLVLDGDPFELLLEQLVSGSYALAVFGRKARTGSAAWRSRNLPGKLVAARASFPTVLVVVPEDAPLADIVKPK